MPSLLTEIGNRPLCTRGLSYLSPRDAEFCQNFHRPGANNIFAREIIITNFRLRERPAQVDTLVVVAFRFLSPFSLFHWKRKTKVPFLAE